MKPLLQFADRLRRIWWRVYGARTIGVRGLVLDDDGRVLLVRHTYGPDRWHLPGGGVRRRESLAAALGRELVEEVGVVVTGEAELFGVYSSLTEGRSDHIAVFLVRRWQQRRVHPAEIAGHEWFHLGQLPGNTSRGTRRRVEELGGTRPRTFDW